MKKRGFTLLEMLLVIVFVFVMALLLVPGTARADDQVNIKQETAVNVSQPTNPASAFAGEIFSFMTENGIGGGAYISNQTGDMVPTISLQLGESPHKWLNWGLNTPIAEDNILKALGGYGAINGNKVIEKVINRYPTAFGTGLGYTLMYYFQDAGDIKSGLDDGLFMLFFQKQI